MPVDLGEFDGRTVRSTTMRVTNAGDGLSKALQTAPQLLHFGDRVFIVMEAVVGPIGFDPIDDDPEGCIRKQSVAARTVTLVGEKLVRQVLDAQADANEKLQQMAGQMKLTPEAKTEADHLAGMHKRKRAACSLCHPEPTDEEIAHRDELAARRAAHGDGEGDKDNPLPPARRYRTRAKGAAKRTRKQSAKKS